MFKQVFKIGKSLYSRIQNQNKMTIELVTMEILKIKRDMGNLNRPKY